MKELRSFEEVRHTLNNIPNINSGGCGISALAMYLWLEKYNGVKPKIWFCFKQWDKDLYENNKSILKNLNEEIENGKVVLNVPNHIGIQLKRALKKIDSECTISKDYYKFQHQVDLNKLILTIQDIDNWNPAFDREKYVSLIEKKLGITLPIAPTRIK